MVTISWIGHATLQMKVYLKSRRPCSPYKLGFPAKNKNIFAKISHFSRKKFFSPNISHFILFCFAKNARFCKLGNANIFQRTKTKLLLKMSKLPIEGKRTQTMQKKEDLSRATVIKSVKKAQISLLTSKYKDSMTQAPSENWKYFFCLGRAK